MENGFSKNSSKNILNHLTPIWRMLLKEAFLIFVHPMKIIFFLLFLPLCLTYNCKGFQNHYILWEQYGNTTEISIGLQPSTSYTVTITNSTTNTSVVIFGIFQTKMENTNSKSSPVSILNIQNEEFYYP